MAVQMTRAEYEKTYGVKPVFSSTSPIDAIQPLPIRMTQAEYDAMYRPTTPDRKGVIKDIPSDIVETAKGFMSSAKKGADNFTRAFTQPDLTVPQRAAGAIVAAPSALVNMAGEVILGAGKLFTSDEFEKTVAQKVGETGKAAMDTKVGKGLTDFYNELSDEDKYTLTNIIAPTANVMTAAPITKGAGAVADKTSDAIIAARNAVDPVYKKLNPTALEKVVKEIAKVEEKYAPIRKANTYAKDVDASRARIAASNVLENAVDENGLLQTTDAIKAYKAMTLDGTENVIRANLINEGKTVNLAELTKTLKTEIYASGLEGSDLIAALRKIDSEVEGLAQRADNIGELSLAKLQDAKISHYNNINFNTPPEVKTYRKAVARAYKETIEQKSEVKVNVDGKDFDIKGINARLAEYLGDIERLERLNGRKVEGGRLGKYTASLAGTGIGMAAGSVGGGLGAAVGGILGGEAAQLLKGGAMSRTFKKGVKGGLPEDQVLKKAAELAKAGKKVDLKTPSKKVGAPKGVPKTKEITRTEGLIAKNVEAQKKAIKAGDFTLVATLKEVYETLVAKLKELIKEVVEAQKNPRIGQKGSVDFFAPLPKKSKAPKVARGAVADNVDDVIMENMMRLDPMKVDPADTYRLGELQKLAEKRALTETEILEARAIVENADGSLKGALTDTPSLMEEAKKYKSAEEFVENQMSRGDGMQHRPTFTKATAADVSQKASDFGLPDFYKNPQAYRTGNAKADNESIQALLKVRNKPDAEVTIYRASPKDELRDGDWVTLSKEYARGESLAEGTKVHSFTVKAKDIHFAGDSINEFGYFPSAKVDELSEVWKKATRDGADVEDAYLTFLKKNTDKYKTVDEWVTAMRASGKTRSQLEDIWKQANGKTGSSALLEEAKKYKSAEEFVNAVRKQSDNAGGLGVRESKLPEVYKKVNATPENAPTGDIDFLDVTKVTVPNVQGDLKLFEPHPNFKNRIKAASFDKGKTNFIFMKQGADPANLQVRQKYEFAPSKWNTKDYYLTNDGGKNWFQLEPIDEVNWLESGRLTDNELKNIWEQV